MAVRDQASRTNNSGQPERAKRSGVVVRSVDSENAAPTLDGGRLSRSTLLALQRTAGNRAARSVLPTSHPSGPPVARVAAPATEAHAGHPHEVDAPTAAPAADIAEAAHEVAPAPVRSDTARATTAAPPVPMDLVARWAEAQRDSGITASAPSRIARSVAFRAPTIRPGTKGDTVTVAADVATIGAGAATGAKLTGDGLNIPGIGEVAPSVDVLEFSAAAAEILTFVSLGLNIFSLGENLVRGWDAKIRFAAFTKAYQALPANDPIRPYLVEAAKQQQWEKKRRWIRVAVTATIIGLTIAALTVASGGALLLAIAAVLSVGKAIETMKNLWKKYKAKKQQQAAATEMVDQALQAGPNSPTFAAFAGLMGALNIPIPDATKPKKEFDKARAYAIDQLAPHLSRTDEAIRQAVPEQAAAVIAAADAQADVQIAQVEAAAAARGVDAGAQDQAHGGPPAGGQAPEQLPGQPDEVAS